MTYRTSTALAEFDRWSRSYDRSILQLLFFGPSHERILRHLTAKDLNILDIGCGTGRFAVEVLRRHPESHVWGLDLSSKMLEHAVKRCDPWRRQIRLTRGDSERLPFVDSQFDVVTCSHSFHHYPNQARVVAEMYRVLRPGGRLMLIDGCRDGWWGWFIFDVIVTLAEGQVHHCAARRLRKLFKGAGFRQVVQEHRGGPLPFLMTIGHAEKPAATRTAPRARAA
jgi:ubiquinone/menaquinone biosynthesis C-methylase UbiE